MYCLLSSTLCPPVGGQEVVEVPKVVLQLPELDSFPVKWVQAVLELAKAGLQMVRIEVARQIVASL